MGKPTVSFLIPAYRDEDTISTVVSEAVALGKKITSKFEVIVINDASPDATGEVLEKLKKQFNQLKVITHQKNAGYGGTIKDLYYAGKNEWLFTVPGDNQIPVSEITKLMPFINKADIILGRRVNRHDPPARLRQSKIYNVLLHILYGIKIHDVNTVRLIRRSVMEKIKLTTTSAFVDAEQLISAGRAGFKIIEVPIEHSARSDESGAGGGSLRTILPTIVDMIKFRLY
jgi:glycosyltransferase involved in cell wall biosynthesis